MLEFFMQQISKELAIDPPLKPQTAGTYVIPFEDYDVSITPMSPQGVILNANLGPFPKDREEEFFQAMLRANLFGETTHGAVLGLSADATTMTLSHAVEYRIDYGEFKDIVEDFLNTADFWCEEAKEQVKSP